MTTKKGDYQNKYKTIGEIMDFCETNNIYSFARLIRWCQVNNKEWFRTICDNTEIITEYLESRFK